jgi:hypothetical protein
MQPNQGPSVQNCSIYDASSTAVSGIHAGDISNIHLTNVAVNDFDSDFRAQVRTNQIGLSVEAGIFCTIVYIDAIVETSNATGTAMSVSVTGTGKVGGDWSDDVVFLRGECVNSCGPCTGSTLLNLGASAQFVVNGFYQ